jgi:pimeloyl-ACP methyl ester carboxylesterase
LDQIPLARLVTVKATDRLLLPALFYEPARPTKRLIVWLHGMGSSGIFYSVDHTNALAGAITSTGTAFLGLQNRGGGMLQGLKYDDENGERQRLMQGTSHELIADCVHDIDGAITFAMQQGYTELYIGGHSTGANKVALYNYLKAQNPFVGYVLYGGGDDTGIFFEDLGRERFEKAIRESKRQIDAGHGTELAPFELMEDYFSYQSAFDILNPAGGYNTFPMFEVQSGTRLGTKELFREYKTITKPTLVIYGAADEFCRPDAATVVDILKAKCPVPAKFSFELIPGASHGGHPHETEVAHTIATWVEATAHRLGE